MRATYCRLLPVTIGALFGAILLLARSTPVQSQVIASTNTLMSGRSGNPRPAPARNLGASYGQRPTARADSVVEAWVRHYCYEPALSWDEAAAIGIDHSGNIAVTGTSHVSDGGATLADIFTISYDASGSRRWVARYGGPDSLHDVAEAMVVDARGNVYVTGATLGTRSGWDYLTLKYDEGGTLQWASRYNDPENGLNYAAGIAVDASGNVYVTGSSSDSAGLPDFLTVKYDPAGREQWVARYDGPAGLVDYPQAIAVGGSGAVYVTGASDGQGTYLDITTVKYDAGGLEQWVARYNGSGNSDDEGHAVAVDASDYVYVAGSSLDTASHVDYTTIKYSSSGSLEWIVFYDAARRLDNATAMALDMWGNVHVTGTSFGPGASADFATVKYDAGGSEQWNARYDGPGQGDDGAEAIAVDAAGTVSVTGWSTGDGTGFDYATVTYDAGGTERWVARYNARDDQYDYATGITLDPGGGVYVTGWTYDETGSISTTIKYEEPPPLAVNEVYGWRPESLLLMQNYPNPFNPATTISYFLPRQADVRLTVANILGEEVARLAEGEQAAGLHRVEWDASDRPTGIYLCRLNVGAITRMQRMILIR